MQPIALITCWTRKLMVFKWTFQTFRKNPESEVKQKKTEMVNLRNQNNWGLFNQASLTEIFLNES